MVEGSAVRVYPNEDWHVVFAECGHDGTVSSRLEPETGLCHRCKHGLK